MKKQITKMSLNQTSKTIAVWYFLLSLFFAIPIGIYSLWHHEAAAWAWFIIPVFYLVLSYILTFFMFWLYNIVAKWVGGVEFNLEDKE